MKKLLAVLPCYNEEQNIRKLVNSWLDEKGRLEEKGYELFILTVDDKSTDNTKRILRELAEGNESVRLTAHDANKGLGGAVETGFRYFMDHFADGDLCVVMDGDNTHHPRFVADMADMAEKGFDCVIASRFSRGSGVYGVPWYRNLMSCCARWYYGLILRVPSVRDYTCGYRAYTYHALKTAFDRYDGCFITQRGFSCMTEILYKLYEAGAGFAEIPFVLRYDFKQGESKMKVMKTAGNSLVTALRLRTGRI